MVYTEFLTTIQRMLEERLGDGYTLRLLTIPKNNGILLDGLSILPPGTDLAPTVYLNSFYGLYLEGIPMERIVDEIQKLFEDNPPPDCILADQISDFSRIAPKVMMKLVQTRSNQKLLSDVPHIPFMDLSVIFYLSLGRNSYGQMTALIHREHMNLWNTDVATLFRLATVNTPAAFPALIQGMDAVLTELARNNPYSSYDESALEKLLEKSRSISPLYVLSNTTGIYGACCLLYPGILKDFAESLDSDLVIVPSSIHEVLLTPIEEDMTYESLNSMVASINQSDVPAEDRLSDHVYLYHRRPESFSMVLPSGETVQGPAPY